MRAVYSNFIKRVFDILVSLVILLVASPFMIIIAILLYVTNHRPVFFTQLRPGHHQKIFLLYKFRSMTDAIDEQGRLLPDDKRLTSLGKFIRKTSMDELPQLFNVLKGDMSIVGPRPLLVDYLSLYNDRQQQRHSVMPGITGWAQVNGRNAISWEQKLEYDAWYAERQSFMLDFKILLMTVRNVLLRKGISEEGHVTASPFTGNKTEKA